MVGAALMAAVALAPDANGRIAFTSFRDGGQGQIYTMAADGSDQRRISVDPGYDAQPEFSPDGRSIAFRRGVSQDYEVWVMGAAGESPRRLTDTPAGSNSTQPSWLPDGSGLVFRRGPNRGTDVWRMAADGSAPQPLVTAPDDQWYPSVSPADGSVLFATTITSSDRSIQVSDASGIRTLRDLPGVYDSAPAYSPDGARIAFESDADGDMEIYVMNADGSDVRQLTRNAEHDEGPVFSPDGTKIAFTRGENDVATDIWTMHADGSDQRQLTSTTGRDESPDWQAVPAPPSEPGAPPPDGTPEPGGPPPPSGTPEPDGPPQTGGGAPQTGGSSPPSGGGAPAAGGSASPPSGTTPPANGGATPARYAIALAGRKPRLRKALHRGLRLNIEAAAPARLTARARSRRVARRTVPAGQHTVRLRFSAAARKRLRAARRVRLTLRLATARRTVTLRR